MSTGRGRGTGYINNQIQHIQCHLCQGMGHVMRDCPNMTGGRRPRFNNYQQYRQPMRGYYQQHFRPQFQPRYNTPVNQQQVQPQMMPRYNTQAGMQQQTVVPMPPALNERMMHVGDQQQGGDIQGVEEYNTY